MDFVNNIEEHEKCNNFHFLRINTSCESTPTKGVGPATKKLRICVFDSANSELCLAVEMPALEGFDGYHLRNCGRQMARCDDIIFRAATGGDQVVIVDKDGVLAN